MPNLITRVVTWLNGEYVGSDEFGNKYYRQRKPRGHVRRWVVYARTDDASRVPSGYHAWLHYTVDEFPQRDAQGFPWQMSHIPNRTGTPEAWRPRGHPLAEGRRPQATGDYQAWRPE